MFNACIQDKYSSFDICIKFVRMVKLKDTSIAIMEKEQQYE